MIAFKWFSLCTYCFLQYIFFPYWFLCLLFACFFFICSGLCFDIRYFVLSVHMKEWGTKNSCVELINVAFTAGRSGWTIYLRVSNINDFKFSLLGWSESPENTLRVSFLKVYTLLPVSQELSAGKASFPVIPIFSFSFLYS